MSKLLHASTAALLCVACSSGPEPLPQTYDEWLEDIGPASGEFTPYHADFQFDMEMDLAAMLAGMEGVDVEHEGEGEFGGVMRFGFEGGYDLAAPELGHFAGTLHFDMAGLADGELEGPIDIGITAVSDGTTVYLEPEWQNPWMKEAMDGGGDGFSKMVFTARVSTVARFYETFGEMMDAQGTQEWLGGRTFSELMSEGMKIDAWARYIADFAEVHSFEVIGDEVHVNFGLTEEYWAAVEEMAGSDMDQLFGGQEMFTGLEYEMVADLKTGVAKSMVTRVDGMMKMDFRMDVEVRSPEDWEAEHFRYHLPEGRHLFPVDQFLDLARTILSQSVTGAVVEDDIEF